MCAPFSESYIWHLLQWICNTYEDSFYSLNSKNAKRCFLWADLKCAEEPAHWTHLQWGKGWQLHFISAHSGVSQKGQNQASLQAEAQLWAVSSASLCLPIPPPKRRRIGKKKMGQLCVPNLLAHLKQKRLNKQKVRLDVEISKCCVTFYWVETKGGSRKTFLTCHCVSC